MYLPTGILVRGIHLGKSMIYRSYKKMIIKVVRDTLVSQVRQNPDKVKKEKNDRKLIQKFENFRTSRD